MKIEVRNEIDSHLFNRGDKDLDYIIQFFKDKKKKHGGSAILRLYIDNNYYIDATIISKREETAEELKKRLAIFRIREEKQKKIDEENYNKLKIKLGK